MGLNTEIMRALGVLVGAYGSNRFLSVSLKVASVVLYGPVGAGSVMAAA